MDRRKIEGRLDGAPEDPKGLEDERASAQQKSGWVLLLQLYAGTQALVPRPVGNTLLPLQAAFILQYCTVEAGSRPWQACIRGGGN